MQYLTYAIRSSVVIAVVIALTGCALFDKEEDITRDWSAQKLYAEAKAALNAGDYETAIDYYQKFEARFPSLHRPWQLQGSPL